MLVRYKHGDDPDVQGCERVSRLSMWTARMRHPAVAVRQARLARRTAPGAEMLSLGESTLARFPWGKLGRPDVVNLHWVADYIDPARTLPQLAELAPLVWTLHDANAFTGGCHYTGGCERFQVGCGGCPQLGSQRAGDVTQRVWWGKQQGYRRIPTHRLHIVAPSRWLAREAARSSLLGRFPSSVIPNGIDTNVFSPVDRVAARWQCGVPASAEVVLFVADSLRKERKGISPLVAALRELRSRKELVLLTIGSQPPELPARIRQRHLGRLHEERSLAAAYSAADVFVIPSLEDNLPNTVLESLACGTPVAGFAAGGIPDMVRPGETGGLVPTGDAAALARLIERLLDDPEARRRMSCAARELAIREYSLEHQAERYSKLYQSLVGDSVAAAA
jgi:glycosyltransferase involved in cell wall biosynthesis